MAHKARSIWHARHGKGAGTRRRSIFRTQGTSSRASELEERGASGILRTEAADRQLRKRNLLVGMTVPRAESRL